MCLVKGHTLAEDAFYKVLVGISRECWEISLDWGQFNSLAKRLVSLSYYVT